MFDTLQLLGKLEQWGNPWHGRLEPGGLRLPNGALRPYASAPPANAPDTYLVRFEGMPEPETPEEQTALGMQWYPDAVLHTLDKRYAAGSPQGFGYTAWLWRSPLGEVWCLRLVFSWAGSVVTVGASTTTGLQVRARRLGLFGEPQEAPALNEVVVLDTSLAWTNRGPDTSVVFPHLAHSPKGDRTAITLRTGPNGWQSVPTAVSSGARQAMVAAGRGSALYELSVTGVDAEGVPVIELAAVVASADARTFESGESAATPRYQQDVLSRGGESTSAGDWPPGVSGTTGWELYGQPLTPSTFPTNTYNTLSQLVCGLYDTDGALRQVWYRRHETDTFNADEPGNVDYARHDFSYTWVSGSAPTEYLTGQRDMEAFSLVSLHSRSQLIEYELLLDGVVVDQQTREIYSYRRVTVDYEGHSLSDLPPWEPGPAPGFPRNQFVKTTVDHGEVRVNGITVATGLPGVPDSTVIDPVRHAWADFPPRVLSSNVVALCPRGGSPANSWVETIAAVDGSTYTAPSPLACGGTAQQAAAAWNPRDGALSLVINAINGYV